jgi:hypothetical protein
MERDAWRATGTKTEAERQELSGENLKDSQDVQIREFLTGVVHMEDPAKWARSQRLVRMNYHDRKINSSHVSSAASSTVT